ncbi:MAG: mechanosensitive ion channel family protein [Infirmifilum sp.]
MTDLYGLELQGVLVVVASLVATVIIGYLFSYVTRRSLRKYNPLLAEALARYGSWTIYMAGVLFSLELLNLKLETLLVFIVFIGILVVIGLRDTLPNYFARQFIEMYQPFNVGEWIEVDGITGRVIEVNDLYTQLVTPSHVRVLIPNRVFLEKGIKNISRSGGVIVPIFFNIPLTGDAEKTVEKIVKAIQEDVKEEGAEEPEIRIVEVDKDHLRVAVNLRILNPQRLEDVRSKILLKVSKLI